MRISIFACLLLLACGDAAVETKGVHAAGQNSASLSDSFRVTHTEPGSWPYFLQHLPVANGPILDYRGRPVPDQSKHTGIIPYDVGMADLQQCADALMRLRAEYLFEKGKYDSIGFHFVNGTYYSWNDYCKGQRPSRGGESMMQGAAQKKDHASLRAYLDLVYMYASTLSLAKELKPAGFAIGTIIINPGSPGHCCIIIDERTDTKGHKTYRIAEGYTPAQSIYVLRNPNGSSNDPWQPLSKGPIETASYSFQQYNLGTY